ncbi:hypothetical protein CHUAL_002274 [Chamberlinius hualienensis]
MSQSKNPRRPPNRTSRGVFEDTPTDAQAINSEKKRRRESRGCQKESRAKCLGDCEKRSNLLATWSLPSDLKLLFPQNGMCERIGLGIDDPPSKCFRRNCYGYAVQFWESVECGENVSGFLLQFFVVVERDDI